MMRAEREREPPLLLCSDKRDLNIDAVRFVKSNRRRQAVEQGDPLNLPTPT